LAASSIVLDELADLIIRSAKLSSIGTGPDTFSESASDLVFKVWLTRAFISSLAAEVANALAHFSVQNLALPYKPLCGFLQCSHASQRLLKFSSLAAFLLDALKCS
jgi:hypothetical protein